MCSNCLIAWAFLKEFLKFAWTIVSFFSVFLVFIFGVCFFSKDVFKIEDHPDQQFSKKDNGQEGSRSKLLTESLSEEFSDSTLKQAADKQADKS